MPTQPANMKFSTFEYDYLVISPSVQYLSKYMYTLIYAQITHSLALMVSAQKETITDVFLHFPNNIIG